MKQVLDVIGKGAAQSWQMDNRGKTMVDDKFDFGFGRGLDAQGSAHQPGRVEEKRRGAAVTEIVNAITAKFSK